MVDSLAGIEKKYPAVFQKDNKKINVTYASTGQDSFKTPAGGWRTCRDQFASDFTDKIDVIYYMFNNNASIFPNCKNIEEGCQNVARFINDTERRLKWKLTHFHRTEHSHILYVHIRSERWLKSGLYRSLFTLLLRTGVNYSAGTTYEQVLDANPYAKSCKTAIKKFLDGFTIFKKDVKETPHWTGTFQNKQDNFINEKLRPNKDRLLRQMYYEWEAAGCPDGKDAEMFEKAKQTLK